MKKNLFFFLTFLGALTATSQVTDANRAAALQLVNTHKTAIGLSEADRNNFRISDSYFSKSSGLRLVYLQQTFNDIPVYNQLQVLAFRNDSLVSNAGGRIPEIEKLVNGNYGILPFRPNKLFAQL